MFTQFVRNLTNRSLSIYILHFWSSGLSRNVDRVDDIKFDQVFARDRHTNASKVQVQKTCKLMLYFWYTFGICLPNIYIYTHIRVLVVNVQCLSCHRMPLLSSDACLVIGCLSCHRMPLLCSDACLVIGGYV